MAKNKVSLSEVAKKAGVSNAAVSYVINNKPGVSKETSDKVNAVIEELGYIPRSKSPAVKYNSQMVKNLNIGIVMPDTEYSIYNNPFYSRIFYQLDSEVAARCGATCILRVSELQNQNNLKVNGYVSIGFQADMPIGLPYVSLLGHTNPYKKITTDHIEPDNWSVGVAASEYLISKGHKHIAFFHPHKKKHSATNLRRSGFVDYAESLGIKVSLFEEVVYDRNRDGSGLLYSYDDLPEVQKFMSDFLKLKDKPTGLFIPSDSHLVIFQNSFIRNGIKPGIDIELVGCNNEVPLITSLDPRPATVDLNTNEMAKIVVERLIDKILGVGSNANIQVLIQPKLVEAGSGVKKNW